MSTTMKRTQTDIDDHPLDSQAETASTATQMRTQTEGSCKNNRITSEELHRQIIEENAVRLWFHPCNQSIPLQRGETMHTIVEGNLQNRKAVAELDEKQYQTLDLTDEEITYLHRYCYQHLIEYYAQGRKIIHEPQSAPIDEHLEHMDTLQQQLHYAQQIAIEEKEQHSLADQENQQLRQERAELEELLDLDLDELLDRSTVPPSDSETLLSPYAPERLNAKLVDLKGRYHHAPSLLLEEVEQIARSAWKSLDSQYHREHDRREHETINQGIQQTLELIPAEKDTVIGLVKENLTRYPTLDSEMSIAVGQFNRKHVGMADDTTISNKFKSLHQIGVLLDYTPGEIDKSNPDRPVTTPARIRLNPEMILTPSKIKKPKDLKPGGDRQSPTCKNAECPASDPFSETEHQIDIFKAEYCNTCETVALEALPGTRSAANALDMIKAVQEGRVLLSEQLHRFAENAKQQTLEAQKHDAFGKIEAPAKHHIYVDDIATFETKLPYKQWCHMTTDGPIEDLHAIAAQIGLKREWFQNKEGHPHYDLTPSKRKQAIVRGAIAVSSQELIQICYPRLASGVNGQKHDALTYNQAEIEHQEDSDRCATCRVPVEKAEDFYYTEECIGYCYQHGPQARPQIGQRVTTPAGLATITNIVDCSTLKRLRCSVHTEQRQPDGSHFRAFNLSEVHIAPA